MSWCCAGGCTCGSQDNPLGTFIGFIWWGFVLSMTAWAACHWLLG